MEIFILSDVNQSEPTFIGHGSFNKVYVNQSKLSSISHGFFSKIDIVRRYQGISSQVVFVVITNQNEVFKDFKILCRSEPNYVYEISQSINLIDLF